MTLDISKLDIVDSEPDQVKRQPDKPRAAQAEAVQAEAAQAEAVQAAAGSPFVAAGEVQPRPRPGLWQSLRRWWRGRTYNPYKSTSMAFDQDGEEIRYIECNWQNVGKTEKG